VTLYLSYISFNGAGITNNSGITQNLVAANSDGRQQSGSICFEGTASAGENVVITNEGGASASGDGYYGGATEIGYNVGDSASAGRATFINNGGTMDGSSGGFTFLLDASTAERATFISQSGAVSGARAGYTWVALYSPGNIHNSTFITKCRYGEPGRRWLGGDRWQNLRWSKLYCQWRHDCGPQAGQIYVYGGDGYATFTGDKPAVTRIAQDWWVFADVIVQQFGISPGPKMAREQQRETNGKSVRRSSEKVTSGVSLPSRRRIIIRLPFAIGSKTQRQRFSFLQPFQLFPERSSQTEQQQLFSGAFKGARLPARMRV
jgi:hypothetical protein